DRCEEVIIVGADCKVVRCYEECCAIRSAIENIGDLNWRKCAKKIWDVAGSDLREDFTFTRLKIERRDFLDELGTRRSVGWSGGKLKRLSRGGKAPEKHQA